MQGSFLKRMIIGVIFTVILFSVAMPVFAQSSLIPCNGANGVPNTPKAANPGECTFQDFVALAKAVANKIVIIGLALAPIIFAYVGYLLITSSDNPGKRTLAKKIGWNVAIGLVIMMLAWLLVKLVLDALVNSSILTWG